MAARRKMSPAMRAVIVFALLISGYIAFEAYSIYAETREVPPPSMVFEAVQARGDAISGWLGSLVKERPGSIEYRVVFGPEMFESRREFDFRLQADDILAASKTLGQFLARPALEVPAGCRSLVYIDFTADVTCGEPMYSRLASYIANERARIERNRANLPFSIIGMSAVVTFRGAEGLGVKVRPNSRTEADKTYDITVYDEDGKSRGSGTVVWTRPELNAKSEWYIAPFKLTRNEQDTYGKEELIVDAEAKDIRLEAMDLRPFFSVLMDGEPFDSDSPQVRAWIERNVSIRLAPTPTPTPTPTPVPLEPALSTPTHAANVPTQATSPTVTREVAPAAASTPVLGTPTSSVPLEAGLVSWWMGEGNAGDRVDGNHGRIGGGVTFTTGVVGQAFSFDGVNGYLEVKDAPSLSFGDSSFTIDAWIKPFRSADGLFHWVVDKSLGNSNLDFGLGLHTDGRLRFSTRNLLTDVYSPSVIPANVWTHVAAVQDKDAGLVLLYLNGMKVAVKAPLGEPITSNAPLVIGGRYTEGATVTHFFAGIIDDIHLYKRALSPAEIKALFDAGRAGNTPF